MQLFRISTNSSTSVTKTG